MKPSIRFSSAKLHLRTGATLEYDGELHVERGVMALICGENGAGKSVTLAALATAFDANHLSIVRAIEPQPSISIGRGKRVAMVRQDPLDNFISRTASDELAVPLFNYGYSEDEARRRILEVLVKLDINCDLLNQPISSLSGGNRQILAIAVAASTQPDILLLDEPLARLDDGNADLVLKALKSVLANTSIVVSTHEPVKYLQMFAGQLSFHELTRTGRKIQITRTTQPQGADVASPPVPSRRTVEVFAGNGEVCFQVCPGNVSVFHNSLRQPLSGCFGLSFTIGANVIYGGNGAGKTLLARCLAGQIRINSVVPLILGVLGDFGGLLSGLHGKGSLEYVLPNKLWHSAGAPPVTFFRYRKSGLSAFRPSEPASFLSEATVQAEVGRFVAKEDLGSRLDYLADRDIEPRDRLSQLSFGQQKLVMFASIPRHARLVVLDEPLSGLSQRSREAVSSFLKELLTDSDISAKCLVATANKAGDKGSLLAIGAP